MCGIVGIAGLNNANALQAMLKAVAHRGPDDDGVWVDEREFLGLAHARLSIIDLSAMGHQPMWDASRRYIAVYNGEVYNHRELRAKLQSVGVKFQGQSDTEVVLELFARFGPASLVQLNGIFSLAIWDKERRELIVARDALGVKPLYYTEGPSHFAFASELKALLPVLETRTLDAVALHRYLSFLWCPGEGTPLREVRRVEPGEAIVVRDGRVVNRFKWYELPARRSPHAARTGITNLITGTAETIRAAVQRQMVADVKVGAFLSGGLDSSSVVAFAREQSPDLHCFSIDLVGGNDAGFADDLPYARRVAKHLGVQLDVVSVPASRMAADLEEMFWTLDEPLADPAPLNVLYISRLARERGIKVLLSGAGGDDLFSGYRRHLALRYERMWSWMPAGGRRLLAAAARQLNAGTAVGRRAQRLFAHVDESTDQRLAGYFKWARAERLYPLYSRRFRAELAGQRADQPMLDYLAGISEEIPPLERMLALEQRFFLSDHNLAYTDRMSMAVGVEVRVPFLDIEVVDWAARIPDKYKQRGTVGKWVLKKAMEPHLPHDVIYRPKTGFGAPLRRWLRNELRPLADDLLSTHVLSKRGLFDPASVQRLRDLDACSKVDGAYTILALMGIEIWCRRFVDGNAA